MPKETTKSLINLGHASISKVVNLMNVHSASTIDVGSLSAIEERNKHTCSPQSGFRSDSSEGNDTSNDDDRDEILEGFSEVKRPVVDVDRKKNQMCICIRWIKDNDFFAEIEPPFFNNVGLVRFSPTGKLLLVGNENCQHFYIYKLFKKPGSKYPHCDCKLDTKLMFSLFRGYTPAVVIDASFALNP